MKKMKCILLAVLIASFANANDGSFNLSISTDGKLILQKAQLLNADGYNNTIEKTNKEYVFSNTINKYCVYTLSVDYINAASKKTGSTTIHLILKSGDTKLLLQGTAGKYSVSGASAVIQKDYEALSSQDQNYLMKTQQFESRLRKYRESGNAKAEAQMKDSIAKNETIRNEVYESYILQHPNDVLSMYAMKMYSWINAENPLEVKTVLSKLGSELQSTEEMMEIKKDAEYNEKFMKGVKAPDFTQADTNGTAITLSSLQGKFVLIDFWASWCHPCRAMNPALVRLYHKYKDKGFTILSVSLDSKRESWLKAIHDDKLEWPQVSDLKFWKNEVAKQYKITSVPQNYLLDSQGVILGKNLSEEELDQVLRNELTKSK